MDPNTLILNRTINKGESSLEPNSGRHDKRSQPHLFKNYPHPDLDLFQCSDLLHAIRGITGRLGYLVLDRLCIGGY